MIFVAKLLLELDSDPLNRGKSIWQVFAEIQLVKLAEDAKCLC